MANTHTTNKLDEAKCGVITGRSGPSARRNNSRIFSSITRARNPTAQRRVADLNKGGIWTRDDVSEPLVSVASPGHKRVAGLHRGVVWTSEDFDEPLPDEFWLGSDQ
jgi:hypothetical protein